MLTIWGRANSINVQKPMWLIGEAGIPHERIDAGGEFGGLDTPDFLALNPNGKVPVIKDEDGVVVWESDAVVRYLAAKYAFGGLWPKGPALRARADMWSAWTANNLYSDFVTVFLQLYRTPEGKRDEALAKAAEERLHAAYAFFAEHWGGGPFVAGEGLTYGDIAIGATLYRYFNMDIDRPRLPALKDYYKRLTDREAYQQHVMVPF